MKIKKVGEIEVYTSNELSKKLTRKEKEALIEKWFKEKYQGKEISYLLNEKEIKAVINATTRRNFLISRHSGSTNEKISELKAKEDFVISNELYSLIKNAKCIDIKKDSKENKNRHHKENTLRFYFVKFIIFDDILYKVVIDINKFNKKYFIYHIKINEYKKRG